jgi:hypothetical protein
MNYLAALSEENKQRITEYLKEKDKDRILDILKTELVLRQGQHFSVHNTIM